MGRSFLKYCMLAAAAGFLAACYESSGTTSDVLPEGELDGADHRDADIDPVPDRPDGPDGPDYPDSPDIPDVPDAPDLPDLPDWPDVDPPLISAEEYCSRFVIAARLYFENCGTGAEL
ncbi:MAG: hypothetical protein ABIJ56_15350, partial [Pseudomonadota bacterium]